MVPMEKSTTVIGTFNFNYIDNINIDSFPPNGMPTLYPYISKNSTLILTQPTKTQ